MASDLEMLSLQPELRENFSMVSNKDLKELFDPSIKHVESSANKEIFNSLPTTGIPLIMSFCRIASAIVSITNKNKYSVSESSFGEVDS